MQFKTIHTELKPKILNELNSLFLKHYHQSLEEVVTDFKIISKIRSKNPSTEEILRTLKESAILNYKNCDEFRRCKQAVERFLNNKSEICKYCGMEISKKSIQEDPFIETCPHCSNRIS